jgi:hypothetical protein
MEPMGPDDEFIIIDPGSAPGHFHAGFKVGWAKHHLRLLDKEIGSYLGQADKPYTVKAEDDVERGEYVISLGLKPPLFSLALMAGDFVACLRGSLDHLVTALTLCIGGRYNDRASFPIIGVNTGANRKSFNNATSGVPGQAVAIIRELQPYHAGDGYKASKLWILHRLWNIDKHRRIPLQPAMIKFETGHPAQFPPLPERAKNSGVVRFPLAAKPYIELKPRVEISITFGDISEGISVTYEDLLDIHNFVRDDVMPRFESFF